MLTLEGAQAGLSWSTILNKREGYRRAFAGFDAAKVARFTPAKVERLLQDPGIVRNRMKVESTVEQRRRVLEVQREHGSLDAYLWSFVGGEPLVGRFKGLGDIPAETAESKAMSKDLKATRVPLRGTDRVLRVHAGLRPGERPRRVVLPLPAGGGT